MAQKEYKARHNWVGKAIHWEMCKEFKFDLANKWYMDYPAPVLENDTREKSRGVLRRLAVTQTPVKKPQLKLM